MSVEKKMTENNQNYQIQFDAKNNEIDFLNKNYESLREES